MWFGPPDSKWERKSWQGNICEGSHFADGFSSVGCVGKIGFLPSSIPAYVPEIYLWIHITPRRLKNQLGAFSTWGIGDWFSSVPYFSRCSLLVDFVCEHERLFSIQSDGQRRNKLEKERKKERKRSLRDRVFVAGHLSIALACHGLTRWPCHERSFTSCIVLPLSFISRYQKVT